MPEPKLAKPADVEQGFRESLTDLVAIGEALGEHCESVSDLVQIAHLATTNDGQLKILMSLVATQKQAR